MHLRLTEEVEATIVGIKGMRVTPHLSLNYKKGTVAGVGVWLAFWPMLSFKMNEW
jgi:hypothetical protein